MNDAQQWIASTDGGAGLEHLNVYRAFADLRSVKNLMLALLDRGDLGL
jgi:hypothetical protein